MISLNQNDYSYRASTRTPYVSPFQKYDIPINNQDDDDYYSSSTQKAKRVSYASPFQKYDMLQRWGSAVTTVATTAAKAFVALTFARFVIPFLLASTLALMPFFLLFGAFSRPYSRETNKYYEIWFHGIPAREKNWR